MKTKLSVIVLLAVILAACAPATVPAPTPNAALISTAAAQTVIANFTLTAAASTPTPLPPPTGTPTSISLPTATIGAATAIPTLPGGTPGATQVTLCDRYSWNDATVDVNVPDNTQMTPGQDFVKTWKIKNVGTCTWDSTYKIIFSYGSPPGEKMSGVPKPINGVIGTGQELEISIQFKAPTNVGVYLSSWTLSNSKGIPFFGNANKPLYVKIVVKL